VDTDRSDRTPDGKFAPGNDAAKAKKVRSGPRGGLAALESQGGLAHEIGHLMLEPLGTMFRDHSISYPGAGWTETRANRFAADLLMPSWMMHVYYSRLGGDVTRLAQKFDVSSRSMEIRIETLFRTR
jgi:hypothetical protein